MPDAMNGASPAVTIRLEPHEHVLQTGSPLRDVGREWCIRQVQTVQWRGHQVELRCCTTPPSPGSMCDESSHDLHIMDHYGHPTDTLYCMGCCALGDAPDAETQRELAEHEAYLQRHPGECWCVTPGWPYHDSAS